MIRSLIIVSFLLATSQVVSAELEGASSRFLDFDVFLKIPLFPCIIGYLQPNHQLFLMKL